MASNPHAQDKAPSTEQNSSEKTESKSAFSEIRLAAVGVAHAGIATSALKGAYTLLPNQSARHLHQPGLAAQMRRIRNTTRDITALVEKEIPKSSGSASFSFTDEEMDMLNASFTTATVFHVERTTFEDCAYAWNPWKMRGRAKMLLRAE